MASQPRTPSRATSHMMHGGTSTQDHAEVPANMADSSPLDQVDSYRNPQFNEEFDAPTRGASIIDGGRGSLSRANSSKSLKSMTTAVPSRGGTLKKRGSLKRKSSLKRSGSGRLSRPGSALGYDGEKDGDELNSAFYTPVPTHGTPTAVLAERFEAWRKVLRDLITYFREIHNSYEQRAKSLQKVNNVMTNIAPPPLFMREGGINEASLVLRQFHVEVSAEETRAREIETGVINQLTGLRGDLKSKIKEIKALSGDFKNSVDKEMEVTRRVVQTLQEALSVASVDPHAVSGKNDPFIVRLAVDRQIERQIDEENYLHRAFLNLEGSGRELDSIVVGEIQKAYNAFANILKREGDANYDAVEKLRSGPLALPKDREWSWFVERDENFVDPRLSLRRVTEIVYPGRDHPLAAEVRAGMLERKSKYLKSYTPGWYVLTPTHLHEFKSAEGIHTQAPVMSLLLTDQKLGTHSQPGSSSHKFMLKGRQTGTMHRGHSWVFRAESHDTMLAWYEDLKALTEKTGFEREAFVRKHTRSVSNGSQKAGSVSSDGGLEEDEADEVPFSAVASSVSQPAPPQSPPPKRPQPGGRFPSDLQVDRGLQAARSASSASSERDRDLSTPTHAAVAERSHARKHSSHANKSVGAKSPTDQDPAEYHIELGHHPVPETATPGHPRPGAQEHNGPTAPRPDSAYGEWMGPTAAGGGATTAAGTGRQHPLASEPQESPTQHHEIGSGSPQVRQEAPQSGGEFAESDLSSISRPEGNARSDPSQIGSSSTAPTTIHQVATQETTVIQPSGILVEERAPAPVFAEAVPFDPQQPLNFRGRTEGDEGYVPGEYPRSK